MKMNAATASLLLLAGAQAQAGGLWLNEYGDFSGGRAAAGAAAGTGDAAAIIYNPAGASGVESGELFVSAGVLIPSTEFDLESSSPFLGDNDGGSAGEIAPGAALAYVDDFGLDTWDFGISLGGMAGAGLGCPRLQPFRLGDDDVSMTSAAVWGRRVLLRDRLFCS